MFAAAKSTENSPRASIGFHALTLATFFGASAAPTPLYRIYQENFSVSPVLITVIFAVYAFALLAALLTAGSISDHLGRKPVIFFALVLEIVAMALFVVASGPGWLIAARIVQGLATESPAPRSEQRSLMSTGQRDRSSTRSHRFPAWRWARSAPAP